MVNPSLRGKVSIVFASLVITLLLLIEMKIYCTRLLLIKVFSRYNYRNFFGFGESLRV